MASNTTVTVHIRVSHLHGLRQCDVCGALSSFLEKIEAAESIVDRSTGCCSASATILEGSICGVIEICAGPDAPAGAGPAPGAGEASTSS